MPALPHPIRQRPALLLAAALTLAACEPAATVQVSPNNATVVTSTADGTSVTTRTGNGLAAVDVQSALPAYAPLFPGAEVLTQVLSTEGSGGKGSVLVLRTDKPLKEVVAFYDQRAGEAGARASMIANDGDSAVRMYGNPGSREGTMIAMSQSPDGTEIAITTGTAAPEADAPRTAVAPGLRLQ